MLKCCELVKSMSCTQCASNVNLKWLTRPTHWKRILCKQILPRDWMKALDDHIALVAMPQYVHISMGQHRHHNGIRKWIEMVGGGNMGAINAVKRNRKESGTRVLSHTSELKWINDWEKKKAKINKFKSEKERIVGERERGESAWSTHSIDASLCLLTLNLNLIGAECRECQCSNFLNSIYVCSR